MSSELGIERITKAWGDTTVLDSVDLRVHAGEVVAVLGRSGGGKTTLLRIVAGLESPDGGAVLIDGVDATRRRPGARDVAMVFQQAALLPHLTVAENIRFGLRGRRRTGADASRVTDAAALVGCADLVERAPGDLSGGERQRVALARALARTPGLVLLDEPLSSLDAPERIGLRTVVRRALEASGATAVHVTHDHAEAFAIADRIAVLDAGTIVQIGTVDELRDAPASIAVASLAGSTPISLLPIVDGAAGPFQLPQAWRGAHPAGVVAGVRATGFRLCSAADDGVDGVVVASEVVDDLAVVQVDCGDLVVRVATGRPGRPAVGDRVRIERAIDAGFVFDAESGLAVRR